MLRNVKDLRGYALRATDGVIGRVEDFYFDDEDWGIRYLVVNTGSSLLHEGLRQFAAGPGCPKGRSRSDERRD